MFGSLVIAFPTYYEGGALILRHRGREYISDSGWALAGGHLDQPSIGYVAFLNDVEQEVAPVTSGHCITKTYNLYFDDDGGTVSKKGAVSRHRMPLKPPNQDKFREVFQALLDNPEFMAEGGTLAFGLRLGYSFKYDLKPIYDALKGSDAVVYQTLRALGLEPMLYMYYGKNYTHEGMIIDKVINYNELPEDAYDEESRSVRSFIAEEGGVFVCQDGGRMDEDYELSSDVDAEPMEWVTPKTTYNRKEGKHRFVADCMDGDACMIVPIGKAGDRLAYRTVA